MKGIPSDEREKEGHTSKKVILPLLACLAWKWLQISTDMLLIITSTGDELLRGVNIDNVEWPWTSKIRVLVILLAIWGCDIVTFQEWIAPKWLEIDQNNLRMKFSAWNVDFSSPSPDPLDSSRPAHVGVKQGYPCKKWLFILCWLV